MVHNVVTEFAVTSNTHPVVENVITKFTVVENAITEVYVIESVISKLSAVENGVPWFSVFEKVDLHFENKITNLPRFLRYVLIPGISCSVLPSLHTCTKTCHGILGKPLLNLESRGRHRCIGGRRNAHYLRHSDVLCTCHCAPRIAAERHLKRVAGR